MHCIAASIVYNNFIGFVETIKLKVSRSPISNRPSYDAENQKLINRLDSLELHYSFSEAEIFDTFAGVMRNLNLDNLYCHDFDLLKVHINNLRIALKE